MSALVTIIIPSYNYGCYLQDALESALAQTYPAVEVLVVDDGSTDHSAEVLEQFAGRIRVIHKENGGLSAARNTGIAEARGEFLAFLDADDRLLPTMVERCVLAMENAGPELGVVGVSYRLINAHGVDLAEQVLLRADPQVGWQQFVLRNRMSPLVLTRREVFTRCGGFDPELKSSEDRDMWIRAAHCFDVAILGEVLAEKRTHGANMSNNARRQSLNMEKVLRKARRMQPPSGHGVGESPMWRQAWAVYYWQSALMFWDCRDYREAWLRLGKSVLTWPFFPNPQELNAGPWFRLKCAVGWARAMMPGTLLQPAGGGEVPVIH